MLFRSGDLFITVTGCRDIITEQHFKDLKDGAILCNAGHFDVEINLLQLAALSTANEIVRDNITAYTMPDGRRIHILASGRLVNLAAGDGHPVEIMDMSFSLQAQSILYLARHGRDMIPAVYQLPAEIDDLVASQLLANLGKQIDSLTPDQAYYIAHWDLD